MDVTKIYNQIIQGDCLKVLKCFPENCVDLVVTSPPYEDRRKDQYNSISEEEWPEWFFDVSVEIMRVLKLDGSFILNIKEGIKNGVRQTYVLKYLLSMAETFRWTEEYIWDKIRPFPTGNKNRFKDGWEHLYQFNKTKNYKFFGDNFIQKNTGIVSANITKNTIMGKKECKNEKYIRPSNVFSFYTFSQVRKYVNHPAIYPEELPKIFIDLMTKQNDIVLDPFSGSGTTALVAKKLGRKYIGIDMSKEYCEASRQRLKKVGGFF
jgi:DNA modification methylase